ncbi:FKBP-type peptidyl-prolyl cis-trans isomerase N-terminal domain-containing protein [Serratia marcescens]|uniref:FKBP-type peptidyl-prolyl cis-trans isomerase N-terminal domain-containing protein n=1 Tax=Serratia marcescens TaxID=615 RepID=UPI003EE0DDEB
MKILPGPGSTFTFLRKKISQALGISVLLLLPSTAPAEPQPGIPAILQFAEQYQHQQHTENAPQTEKGEKTGGNRQTLTSPPQPKSTEKALRWQLKDEKIRQLQQIIAQLKNEINALKKDQAKGALSPRAPINAGENRYPLGKWFQGIRQALALTPTEKQAKARLRQAQQERVHIQVAQDELRREYSELVQRLASLKTQGEAASQEAQTALEAQRQNAKQAQRTLQTQLSDAQQRNQVLEHSIGELKTQLDLAKTTETALLDAQRQQQQQQDELKQQRTTLQAQLDEKITEVANQTAKISTLRQAMPAELSAENLKNPTVRQGYAAGVSLAEEILQMQKERQRWGVTVDKNTLLTGIMDTFAGQRKLDDATINQALETSEKQIAQARTHVLETQEKKGNNFLASFRQDKRVKQTAGGAWYRIDYLGDESIPSDATLDVVVKETLTDGTVIQDMETNGAVLSQPMSQFPPLFADALQQLKNHGTLTLVVPPELAYGEKGYPPNVPPNATMVYTLRIAEMYPDKPAPKATVPHR